jgi:hypothetical protein
MRKGSNSKKMMTDFWRIKGKGLKLLENSKKGNLTPNMHRRQPQFRQ